MPKCYRQFYISEWQYGMRFLLSIFDTYLQGYNIDISGFDFECETLFLPAAQRHGLTIVAQLLHFLHFLGAFYSHFSSLTYQTTQTTHQFKTSLKLVKYQFT